MAITKMHIFLFSFFFMLAKVNYINLNHWKQKRSLRIVRSIQGATELCHKQQPNGSQHLQIQADETFATFSLSEGYTISLKIDLSSKGIRTNPWTKLTLDKWRKSAALSPSKSAKASAMRGLAALPGPPPIQRGVFAEFWLWNPTPAGRSEETNEASNVRKWPKLTCRSPGSPPMISTEPSGPWPDSKKSLTVNRVFSLEWGNIGRTVAILGVDCSTRTKKK